MVARCEKSGFISISGLVKVEFVLESGRGTVPKTSTPAPIISVSPFHDHIPSELRNHIVFIYHRRYIKQLTVLINTTLHTPRSVAR
jgi:hypothetical protein